VYFANTGQGLLIALDDYGGVCTGIYVVHIFDRVITALYVRLTVQRNRSARLNMLSCVLKGISAELDLCFGNRC
jgi:hypothetical protein